MSKLRHRESWYSRTKKELEEMDYKEKYEKALEWMKSIYPTMQGSDKEDAEHYFPELAESEDERIRKELIELVRELSEEPGRGGLTVRKTEMYISYLEKQKEQIPYIDFVIKPHKGDDNNPYDMGVSEAQEYAIKRGFGIPFNDGEVYVDERHMTQTIGNILRWADEHPIEQKDYRELYKGVSQSEWFKKAYVGKSLGEEDEQNEAEFREGYLHGFEDGQKEQKPRWEINNPYTTKWTKEMIDEKFEELVGQEPAELTPLATLLSNYLKNDFEYFATRQWDEKKWNEIMSIQASELLRYAKKELEKEQKPADGKELLYVSNKSYNIGYRDGKRAAEQKPAEGMEYSCSDCGTTSGCTNNESECDKRYQEGITYALGKTEQYTIGSTFMGLIPCWVNAPSTLQPAHKYHGRNAVIMHENNGGFRCCFIDDDKPVTIHLPEDTLFVEGWRKNPKEWSEEDERMSEGFMHKLEVCDLLNNKEIAWAKRRLNSLHPQPKPEWSEEDEKKLELVTDFVFDFYPDPVMKYKLKDWLKSLRPQPIQVKESYKEGFQTARHVAASAFIEYCNKNRPNGKMCLSNGECEDIENAFSVGDWAKIERYIHKYHWKPSEEQMDALKSKLPIIKGTGNNVDSILESLYNDLKKLI